MQIELPVFGITEKDFDQAVNMYEDIFKKASPYTEFTEENYQKLRCEIVYGNNEDMEEITG